MTYIAPTTKAEAIERMREDGDADPEGTARLNYPHLFSPPSGEPVAWGRYRDNEDSVHICAKGDPGAFPLYTSTQIVAALLDPSVTIPGIDNSHPYPMETREKIAAWIESYRKGGDDAK